MRARKRYRNICPECRPQELPVPAVKLQQFAPQKHEVRLVGRLFDSDQQSVSTLTPQNPLLAVEAVGLLLSQVAVPRRLLRPKRHMKIGIRAVTSTVSTASSSTGSSQFHRSEKPSHHSFNSSAARTLLGSGTPRGPASSTGTGERRRASESRSSPAAFPHRLGSQNAAQSDESPEYRGTDEPRTTGSVDGRPAQHCEQQAQARQEPSRLVLTAWS